MKGLLAIFSGAVLVIMLWLTTVASLDRGIFTALDDLWSDLWFRATLADAYLAFLSVYLWVARRERTIASRVLWFVAFMGLGSIGIALYVLTRVLPGGPAAPISSAWSPKEENAT